MSKLYELIEKRVEKLQHSIFEKGFSSILILQPENRRYYSGFTGSNGWLVITINGRYIITDGRYFQQAAQESPLFELVKTKPEEGKELLPALLSLSRQVDLRSNMGFESQAMTVGLHRSISDKLQNINLSPADEIIQRARLIKDPTEIKLIKEAVRLAEEAFKLVRGKIREGITERQLAAELEYRLKMSGAEKASFDIIVAAGENGALPHAKISDRPLCPGEPIIIDWGAKTESGYNSDITRTFFIGTPDPEMADVCRVVLEAQQKALDGIGPGLTTGEVDAIAREHIKNTGFGEYFTHGLGHGVGLAIHEGPTLRNGDTTVLQPGMVVTVEPGIYIQGKGGVRIEDMVVITENGKEIITSLPKLEIGS